MKTCCRCGKTQSLDSFNKNSKKKDGLQVWCKSCYQEIYQTRLKKDPDLLDRQRRNELKRRHGITKEWYNALLKSQDNVCAICKEGNGNRSLAVDHCHTTDIIRGLLCDRCNTTLGKMNEDADLLRSAAEYLDKFNSWVESNREVG